MSGRPTWGSVGVVGLAGFSTGLLVAALLVAGRTPPQPARFSQPIVETPAQPATVTVTGDPPAQPTVTDHILVPPLTVTTSIPVTITPTPTTSTTPTTTTTARTPDPSWWRF